MTEDSGGPTDCCAVAVTRHGFPGVSLASLDSTASTRCLAARLLTPKSPASAGTSNSSTQAPVPPTTRGLLRRNSPRVLLGLAAGEGKHHATAVTPARDNAFAKRLPNSEPELREVLGKLRAKHRAGLILVDQPASIEALPLAAARDMVPWSSTCSDRRCNGSSPSGRARPRPTPEARLRDHRRSPRHAIRQPVAVES
ncbi:IS110 family transposase [Streptomyces sp. NPDC001020]